MTIPFIDIFAGPGGLGEGFSAYKFRENHPFRPVLSIEMEEKAHETLMLRSFYRQFRHKNSPIPKEYYDHVRGKISKEQLFDVFPEQAAEAISEAKRIELGGKGDQNHPDKVSDLIEEKLRNKKFREKNWILLGGPPCQAFSLVGRSRVGGIDPKDPRVKLYRHYLRILSRHRPSAFVFENVKGLASSEVNNKLIFNEILNSLRFPEKFLGDKKGRGIKNNWSELKCSPEYKLFGLESIDDKESSQEVFEIDESNLKSVILRAERHGVPQCRHRIIILGIRKDLKIEKPASLVVEDPVHVNEVLKRMPRLRSGLSKIQDTDEQWIQSVRGIIPKIKGGGDKIRAVRSRIKEYLDQDKMCNGLGRGAEFVRKKKFEPTYLSDWFAQDLNEFGGVCNHSTRAHLVSDLHRYLFSSVYAELFGVSPKLCDYPKTLLPDHKNAAGAAGGKKSLFNDRFRVQLGDQPSKTITSHISKDGHYYIHPDPTQCRSLTVREAARLQTFPDSYFFCGPRTSQYVQVGNAVPPLLAYKIAEVLYSSIKKTF